MKPTFENPRDRICVALDTSDLNSVRILVETLTKYVGFFKIGFELFTGFGPTAVTMVRDMGGKIFLDLKYHDIPATVSNAAAAATRLGIEMFNLHTCGGLEMMERTVSLISQTVQNDNLDKPFLLGVTVLTSLDARIIDEELHITGTLQDHVVHLARLAMRAGLDGVIASPQEITLIREACGPECLIVTPGIRPAGTPTDDQRRIMTPKQAIESGADIIVVGRAITSHPNPPEAAKSILDEIS